MAAIASNKQLIIYPASSNLASKGSAVLAAADEVVTIEDLIETIQGSLSFSEGTYNPVVSGGSNVDSVTPGTAGYLRVGKTVTVFGVVTIDPTNTATPTFFKISLPVLPITWDVDRAGGTFHSYSVNEGGAIIMDSATTVLFQFNPTSVGANVYSYSFSYRLE